MPSTSLDEHTHATTSRSAIALGTALVVAAAAAAYVGYAELFTLRIRRLVLPSWSMYVISGGILLLGTMAFFMAKQRRCRKCGSLLEHASAYFPLELEQHVRAAVADPQNVRLDGLPMVPKNQMKMAIDLYACRGCGEVGSLEVIRWQDFQPHMLHEELVLGPRMRLLRDVAQSHEAWRESQEES